MSGANPSPLTRFPLIRCRPLGPTALLQSHPDPVRPPGCRLAHLSRHIDTLCHVVWKYILIVSFLIIVCET